MPSPAAEYRQVPGSCQQGETEGGGEVEFECHGAFFRWLVKKDATLPHDIGLYTVAYLWYRRLNTMSYLQSDCGLF